MKEKYIVKRKEEVFFQKEKEIETVVVTKEELIEMLQENYIILEAKLIEK